MPQEISHPVDFLVNFKWWYNKYSSRDHSNPATVRTIFMWAEQKKKREKRVAIAIEFEWFKKEIKPRKLCAFVTKQNVNCVH